MRRYPFSPLPLETALRPVIDIEFAGGLTTPALIDSGAIYNKVGIKFADRLKIDLTRGRLHSFTIAGRRYQSHLVDEIDLRVERMPPFRTRVAFVEDWEHDHAILGIQGFFDFFSVRFDAWHRSYVLKPQKRA